ncbi:MAG: tetratricopeptide repeat protein [Acidobacteriota bacterium]|nr:tetratricopeptide repeat protein [Acidobacteriota bacterium]
MQSMAWLVRVLPKPENPIEPGKSSLLLMRPTLMRSTLLALFVVAITLHSAAQTRATRDARRVAALTYEKQGNLLEAEREWKELLRSYPGDPEPYAHLGLIASRQQRYKEAVPLYRKALEIYPNVPGLRLDLALALFKSGELKESIPEFKGLLNAAPPDSAQALRLNILIGMAYYGIANYADAAPYLKKAADRDKTNLPLRLALAHSYMWSKQFKEVLPVYHEILTIDPDSAEADMLAGEALDEMKDNAGATKMFRAAVKANPKLPDVHFGLAYLLWAQKNYPEAATEFQAELDNDPDHVQSMVYLADTFIQMNKMEAARPLLERALKLDHSQALAHLDLGIVLTEAGENANALRELQEAEKLMPDDVNVHWRLGRLYRTLGRKEEARIEFDKASKLNKKADEDLYQKIARGAARRAPQQGGAQAVPQPEPATSPNQ